MVIVQPVFVARVIWRAHIPETSESMTVRGSETTTEFEAAQKHIRFQYIIYNNELKNSELLFGTSYG